MAVNTKAVNKKLAVCYIYHQGTTSFWDNIDSAFKYFHDVFIINISQEEFKTNRKNLKIYNVEEKDFYSFLGNFFLTKKLSNTHVLFLESNEKIILNSTLDLEDNDYNIKVIPKYHELHEYSISPFLTFENRIFNLKRKNLKETFSNLDLYLKKQIPLISENVIYIEKKEIDSDFEILKSANLKEKNNRSKFFTACAYFYKDSILSENLFNEIINSDSEEYKNNSLSLLTKLFIIKQDYKKITELAESHQNYSDSNYYFYLGLMAFENKNYKEALKILSQAVRKSKSENSYETNYFLDNKLVYNISDITHKLYKYIGFCFYELTRYISAEKYLNISLNCIDNYYSPEIKLYLGRIQFNQENHEKAFEIFNEIINNQETSKRVLKELKQPLINLMMFLRYREEFQEILSKDFIDNQDDILRVADTYYMNGDFINALQLYILSVKRFGYDQKLLFKLGYISSMLKSMEQAAYYFEKFLEKEPDNLDALNNLGFLYLNMEKADFAERIYLRIISLNNYSFEANLYLAIIYMSKNIKDKAENYLEKARMLNPVSNEVISLYKIFKKEFT